MLEVEKRKQQEKYFQIIMGGKRMALSILWKLTAEMIAKYPYTMQK